MEGNAVEALRDAVTSDLPAAQAGRPRPVRVRHEAPSAVLIVDTTTGQVVHANAVARALAPVPLPAPAAAWQAAAGLRTPQGDPAPQGTSPLERAARGQEVPGERVMSGNQSLWTTALPVPHRDESLVVMFELDQAADAAMQVRDRAVVAAGMSFTIADPHQPDSPLVYVNPAFEQATGYTGQEALGRNCRFLQGPDSDPDAVQRLREAIAEQQHAVVTLLNYRKDGTAFWNEVSLSPVFDGEGRLTHYVGIQADVTARMEAQQEQERLLLAERVARADAEDAQRRLALLAQATTVLSATLDADEALRRLTDLVVPLLADFCTVDVVDASGGVRRVSSRHADARGQRLLEVVEQRQPAGLSPTSATARVLDGGGPVLVSEIGPDYYDDTVPDPELAQAYLDLGVRSAMVVPLTARHQVLGALTLFASDPLRQFDDDDLVTAADLGRRAAMAVDNAHLYARQHEVAEALQRSLLPTLPEIPGLQVAARYLPSGTASQVGGDWYDVLQLPDGAVGVAVGDVMGHDLDAAASMGQLRSVLRSYAWQGGSPAQVLDHLDQLVQGLGMAQLATALYARLDLAASPASLHYANAGHLPPALRTPDGTVQLLSDASSLLVGAVLGTHRDEAVEPLPAGSVLVLYTDGLVEDRDRDLDEGLQLLAEALAAAPDDAEGICDALTQALTTDERADDVAICVVKVL